MKTYIRQGFAYLKDENQNEQTNQLTLALNEKENQIQLLQNQLDSLNSQNKLGKQIFNELKTQYPSVHSFILLQAINNTDNEQIPVWICNLKSKAKITESEKNKIEEWLKVRINTNDLIINFGEEQASKK